jgi:hypothetical protein
MGYKLLGFAVWKGGKWYVRRRAGMFGSRKGMAAGVVGGAILALALWGRGGASVR